MPTRRQRERQQAHAEFQADVLANTPHSATLRLEREVLANLDHVRALGNHEIKASLKSLEHSIENTEIQQYLEYQRNQPLLTEGEASKSTALTTEALLVRGFSKWQASTIQHRLRRENQDESQKENINKRGTSLCNLPEDQLVTKARVEVHVAEGWRPEHNALAQKIKTYGVWLKDKIGLWESDEILLEYLHEVLENGIESPAAVEMRTRMNANDRRTTSHLADDENAILDFLRNRDDERREALYPEDNFDDLGDTGDAWPEERFRWERSKMRMKNKLAESAQDVHKVSKKKQEKFEEWMAESDEAIFDKESLTVDSFPVPPCGLCPLRLCKLRAVDSLGICAHTLKLWYQRSTNVYREALLLEYRRFHPDRFSKCSDEVRDIMVHRATVYFQLIGTLLEATEED